MLPTRTWFTLLFALLARPVFPQPVQHLRSWVANPLVKIRPTDSGVHQNNAELFAARNEFEPFQIALRAEGKGVDCVDIDFSDLRSARGAAISRNNITVYFEEFIDITHPSTRDASPGLWPDALIPRTDRYFHERRSVFPFNLPQNRTQPLWIEIYVPPQAAPDVYSGVARISSGGEAELSVPVVLTVWAFSLPSTSTLKSSFGFNGTTALKQHRGRYTNDADLYLITRLYQKAALLHRLSTHGGSQVPPKVKYDSGRPQIDWRSYDAEVTPFLDGTVLSRDEPLSGAKVTSVEIRMPSEFPNDAQRISYWGEWTRHFRERAWIDRLFLYLWDEPSINDLDKVLQRGRDALRADSAVRNLVTTPFTKQLEPVVGIWTPLVNCLDRKPEFDNFCVEGPRIEVYRRQVEEGKSLWFYQSCASHGCDIVGGDYFVGWPSYMIDAPGAANRVMQWIAWKLHVEGELYYSMNEAYGRHQTPWTDLYLFGGNGDGTLFYPGRPDRIGGTTDIPIESIRLKLIREGMEDYEYLALLARLAGRDVADKYADRIVHTAYDWESRPEQFLQVRREIGDTIERLKAAEKPDAF
jgi:hypothetical protein